MMPTPPATGNAAVDAVIAAVGDPDDTSLAERYDRLRRAQEALGAILDKTAPEQP